MVTYIYSMVLVIETRNTTPEEHQEKVNDVVGSNLGHLVEVKSATTAIYTWGEIRDNKNLQSSPYHLFRVTTVVLGQFR